MRHHRFEIIATIGVARTIQHRTRASRREVALPRFSWTAAALGLALAVGGTGGVAAQDTVFIGGGGLAPVEVNLHVLNDLGMPLQRRLLLAPTEGDEPTGRLVLRRPGDVAPAAPAPRIQPPAPRRPAPQVTVVPAPAAPAAPARTAPAAPPPQETARTTEPPPPPPPAALSPAAPRTDTAPRPPARAAAPPPAAPAPRVERTVAPPPPPATRAPEQAAPPPARPPETRTAALPQTFTPDGDGQIMRIPFGSGSTQLNSEGEAALTRLAALLGATEGRLQLKAFAGGSADRPSTARRLSLSRALAVRSFLINQGVKSTRIDVRALGVPPGDGPADRVDVILLTQ